MKKGIFNWKILLKKSKCNGKMLVLSMVISIFLFGVMGHVIEAGDGIPLNKEQTYDLPKGYYVTLRIVAPLDGVISISGYNTNNEGGIEMSLIDADNNVLCSAGEYGQKMVYLRSYGVRKGGTYYLKIERYGWNNYDSTMKYTVNFTATNYWEKENIGQAIHVLEPYLQYVPPAYRNSYALQHFVEAYMNLKVNNVAEAVKEYDVYLHRRNVVQGLRQISGQMAQINYIQRQSLAAQRAALVNLNMMQGWMAVDSIFSKIL